MVDLIVGQTEVELNTAPFTARYRYLKAYMNIHQMDIPTVNPNYRKPPMTQKNSCFAISFINPAKQGK